MGSIQDRILELGRNMGEFTTKDMANAVYGDDGHTHTSSTHVKLTQLEKFGYVVKVGKIRNGSQSERTWRVV